MMSTHTLGRPTVLLERPGSIFTPSGARNRCGNSWVSQEPFVSLCLGSTPLSVHTLGDQIEVFEIATFKKTNPDGKVVMAPIFLETIVMFFFLANLCLTIVFVLVRGSGSGSYIIFPALLLSSLPYLIACSSESDRDFILAAIAELYGSHEAFTNYVRGSLREELLGPMTSSTLPAKYTLLILSPLISGNMDFSYSIWNVGAPPSVVLFYVLTFLVMGIFVINHTCVNLVILLCDRFAEPAFARSVVFASWLREDFVSATFRQNINSLGLPAAASLLEDYFQTCLIFACYQLCWTLASGVGLQAFSTMRWELVLGS